MSGLADIVPVSVCPLGATLGEGPVWVAADAALWCVDIKAPRIHRFDPASGALGSWDAPAQVGWVLPAADGGMVAGLQTGVHRFDPADGTFVLVADPETHLPGNRLNDATVGPDGSLWFGSMDDAEEAATGRVHRLVDGHLRGNDLPPVVITNGPAISHDGRLLYHVDTAARTIWAVPLSDAGEPGTPRLFAEIEDGAGHPDGPTIDAEGGLWIGLFGGWGARRYDPAGRLVAHVRFPVANVTKIAFGGPDLATAYATTARKGLSAQDLAAQPQAGDLFAFDAGVKGMPTHAVRL